MPSKAWAFPLPRALCSGATGLCCLLNLSLVSQPHAHWEFWGGGSSRGGRERHFCSITIWKEKAKLLRSTGCWKYTRRINRHRAGESEREGRDKMCGCGRGSCCPGTAMVWHSFPRICLFFSPSCSLPWNVLKVFLNSQRSAQLKPVNWKLELLSKISCREKKVELKQNKEWQGLEEINILEIFGMESIKKMGERGI